MPAPHDSNFPSAESLLSAAGHDTAHTTAGDLLRADAGTSHTSDKPTHVNTADKFLPSLKVESGGSDTAKDAFKVVTTAAEVVLGGEAALVAGTAIAAAGAGVGATLAGALAAGAVAGTAVYLVADGGDINKFSKDMDHYGTVLGDYATKGYQAATHLAGELLS